VRVARKRRVGADVIGSMATMIRIQCTYNEFKQH